jgi:hypothetical protein
MPLKLAVSLLFLWDNTAAFVNSNHSQRCPTSLAMVKDSRRSWLLRVTTASSFLFLPGQAQAKDEIFRSNLLTNPVLEQVRFSLLFL